MILSRRRYVSGGGGFAFGNALLFDGSDDFVSIPQLTANNTWSLSFWFYSSNVSTVTQPIISDSDSNNYVRIDNANSRIIVRRIANPQLFFTGFSFSNNTWYHVAISTDALYTRCWVNDVESSAGTLFHAALSGDINQYEVIGKDNTPNYFTGKMDEFGIWNGYALTDADVTALYNSGSGEDATTIDSPYLVFHFDETGTDTTAADSSGNGNDGTLTNFPASGMWVTH